ncbi:MAG: hypothetical protein ACOH1T_02905 [Microbacteriaceae bacterium]
MKRRERTLQQRDPLAAMVGRPASYLAAIGVPLYAAVMMGVNANDINNPRLALASLSVLAVTGMMFAFASSPMRAPFTSRMLVVVTSGTVVSYLLGAASMWGSNTFVRDDWGPAAIALYLLALAPYRPARDIALAGLAATAVVSVTVLAQVSDFITGVPAHIYVIVAITPLVALSLGAAVFAAQLVVGLERWEAKATMSLEAFGEERSEWIARSVQQDRITILNREVVPFFAGVLDAGVVSHRDRQRALALSDAIRAVMVAEVQRTWLDTVVEQSGRQRMFADDIRGSVADAARLADFMTPDQRTVVRAVIVALHAQDGFDPRSLDVRVVDSGMRCEVELTAALEASEFFVRSELDPYFAVMRILFRDLTVDFLHPTLTLRFSYEQR